MIDIIMWVMTAIAITGFFLNMKMNKWGYVLWIVSNAGFAVNDFVIKQYAQGGLFAFYVVSCIFGFIQWHIRDEEKKPKKVRKLVILTKNLDKNFRKGDVCYYMYEEDGMNKTGNIILKKLHSSKQGKFKGSDIYCEELGSVK
jgi:hypothetical protein